MLEQLLKKVRQCRACEPHLPLGANPVIRAHSSARILIIGQAPGTRVHATSIPWNDPSGDRLRMWMGINKDTFYDESQIAIMPMGFCYPGKANSGDKPPRKECAPMWHEKILNYLPNIEITLLVGNYAQNYYLPDKPATLTETVKQWQRWAPNYIPLPHPSPRNNIWLKRNKWFDKELTPYIRRHISKQITTINFK